MRIATQIALVVSLIGMPGCFHITGNIIENTERVSTPQKTTKEEVQIPYSEKVTFDIRGTEEGIAVTVWRKSMCADEHTTIIKNTEVIERRLPGGYVGLLVTSLVVTGAGIGMWAGGASMIEEGEANTLGDPAEEKKLDQGKILLPIGIGTTALGALFLTFSAIDIGYASDDVNELSYSMETKLENKRRCASEPFGSAKVAILKNASEMLGGDASLALETDSEGNVLFSAEVVRREFCPDKDEDAYLVEVGEITGDITKLVHPLCGESNAKRDAATVDEHLDTAERFIDEGDLDYAIVYLGKAEDSDLSEVQEERYAALKKKYEKLLPAYERKKAKEEREAARLEKRAEREAAREEKRAEREAKKLAKLEANTIDSWEEARILGPKAKGKRIRFRYKPAYSGGKAAGQQYKWAATCKGLTQYFQHFGDSTVMIYYRANQAQRVLNIERGDYISCKICKIGLTRSCRLLDE